MAIVVNYEFAKKIASCIGMENKIELLLQQMEKLAEALGLEIRGDMICKATTEKCTDYRDWVDSVFALLWSVSKVVLYKDVVDQRIRAFNTIAPKQYHEYSCWAVCGLLMDHYRSYVTNSNSPEQVKEEEEMTAKLPTITKSDFFACMNHIYASAPSWYIIPNKVSYQLANNPNYTLPTPEQVLNDCVLGLNLSAIPDYMQYDTQANNAAFGTNVPDSNMFRNEFFTAIAYFVEEIGAHNTYNHFCDVWQIPPNAKRDFFMALYYIENYGLPGNAMYQWFGSLNLALNYRGVSPSQPNTSNFTVEELSRLLRKSPVICCINAETVGFLSNASYSNFGGHVVIVYDIYYELASQQYWVRLLNTGFQGLSGQYDEYAYALLGRKTPDPNLSHEATGASTASFPASFLTVPFASLAQSMEEAALMNYRQFPRSLSPEDLQLGWLKDGDNNREYD